jgi:hypothetical protein
MEFKAFLSHRYRSPEVNLYFHDLFLSEAADVQFDVDIGSLPTNVTRLERMIRESDAFIGIYPFPGDPTKRARPGDLKDASKYFRLECELAARSRKPSLVFIDKRYAPYFQLPQSVRSRNFDIQEVIGKGGKPRRARHAKAFRDFCTEVAATISARILLDVEPEEMRVGIVVPDKGPLSDRYEPRHVARITKLLRDHGVESIHSLPWPPVLQKEYIAEVDSFDWIVADIGESSMRSGLVGYLHGRFIPTLRLLKTRTTRSRVQQRSSYSGLYGGIEVGYGKDLIVWNDLRSLTKQLDARLAVLTTPVKRIATAAQAEDYFRRASLRKQAVFLSYSGRDRKIAAQISSELKKRFQEVFDYRDGESITPGEPWLEEIFDKLSVAKLGIPLVSSDYLASGNCLHEAHEMVAKSDAHEMSLIPLKLYEDDDIKRPTWMRDPQYMHYYHYPDVETIVDRLIEFFEGAQKKLTTGRKAARRSR